jgi:hypothetical protein
VADRSGKAVLVEFYGGEMRIIANDKPWHLATNFLCSIQSGSLEGNCWRFDRVLEEFQAYGGALKVTQAITLLSDVAQQSTQWSVLYEISAGRVNVVMGQDYENVHSFELEDS